jgi:hypothetical protein
LCGKVLFLAGSKHNRTNPLIKDGGVRGADFFGGVDRGRACSAVLRASQP